MKKNYTIIIFVFFIYACNTIDHEPVLESIPGNIIKTYSEKPESTEIIEELTEERRVEIYDLTVLKGKSYPTIKNDTPFTDDELDILESSSEIEYKADIEVAHYFKYFIRDKKDLLQTWIENSSKFLPFIEDKLIEAGLPKELMFLPYLESGYNVNAYSRVGAGGVWQFMPRTAKSYGLEVSTWSDERRNPYILTDAAIKHLKYLYKLYGDWYLTLAAYNAGQGRLNSILKEEGTSDFFSLKNSRLPKETKRYIPQFVAIVKIMNNLETLNFNRPTSRNLPITTLLSKPGIDIVDFTQKLNWAWSSFKEYNPHIIRQISNPYKKTKLIIPRVLEDRAREILLSQKPALSIKSSTYYTVKSGDTLWHLANLSNSSINNLKRINNLRSNSLYVGQKLLLPGIEVKKASVSTVKNSSRTSKLETYTVKQGDTISSISIRYNIKLEALYRENNLNGYSILKIGQIIKLPGYPIDEQQSSRYYTVKDGDSIWLIAQRNNIPYSKLLSLNNMDNSSKLSIGDQIKLY